MLSKALNDRRIRTFLKRAFPAGQVDFVRGNSLEYQGYFYTIVLDQITRADEKSEAAPQISTKELASFIQKEFMPKPVENAEPVEQPAADAQHFRMKSCIKFVSPIGIKQERNVFR